MNDGMHLSGRDETLPTYVEGENLIVAALLADQTRISEVARRLPVEAFTDDRARVAYEVLCEEQGSETAIISEIGRRLGDPDVIVYFTDILQKTDRVHVEDEIDRVNTMYIARSLLLLLDSGINNLLGSPRTWFAFVSNLMSSLREISYRSDEDRLISAADVPDQRTSDLERRRNIHPVLTGFSTLDDMLVEGFAPATVSIIGGRSSNGKTTLKVNLINNIAEAGRGVYNVVLEGGRDRDQDRIEALRLQIPLRSFYDRATLLDPTFIEQCLGVSQYIAKSWNLWINDRPSMFFRDLELDIQRIGPDKIDVVFIDLTDRLLDVQNSEAQAADIKRLMTHQLDVAKQYGLHICNVVQIHRLQKRMGQRKEVIPTMENLRDSGGWEEVADLILLAHRPAYYNHDLPDDVMKIFIAKQRIGPAGLDCAVELSVDWETMTIRDMQSRRGAVDEAVDYTKGGRASRDYTW